MAENCNLRSRVRDDHSRDPEVEWIVITVVVRDGNIAGLRPQCYRVELDRKCVGGPRRQTGGWTVRQREARRNGDISQCQGGGPVVADCPGAGDGGLALNSIVKNCTITTAWWVCIGHRISTPQNRNRGRGNLHGPKDPEIERVLVRIVVRKRHVPALVARLRSIQPDRERIRCSRGQAGGQTLRYRKARRDFQRPQGQDCVAIVAHGERATARRTTLNYGLKDRATDQTRGAISVFNRLAVAQDRDLR